MGTFTSEPGTRLGGRYRLEDRVGAAAGWAAWKAIDETLARPVTVLTFAPGFPRLAEALTSARAASRLSDSRFAQVFDVEDDFDRAYVVTEWPGGEALDDMLLAGWLEPDRGAQIVAETAEALSSAHAAGLAHLCLTPDCVRWTPGGGVKVLGLGIDAALAGISADDPALADTRGLGRLLYAALTGRWPGPDSPALPRAPMADGRPRSPRQVRAGVRTALDDIACQALDLKGRSGAQSVTTPAQLAAMLTAAIPPAPIPQAAPQRRAPIEAAGPASAPADYWAGRPPATAPGRPGGSAAITGGGRPRWRIVAIAALAAIVVTAGVVAALRLGHGGAQLPASSSSPSSPAATHATHPGTAALTPVAARGFDEPSRNADDTIRGGPAGRQAGGPAAAPWESQWYASAEFGNLARPTNGSGLILDMGRPVRPTSVQVRFSAPPGAIVQVMVGNVDRPVSQATVRTFTTVAGPVSVAGLHTFRIAHPAAGRYIMIYFTRLPPEPHAAGHFQARIYSVTVSGTGAG